MSRMWSMPMRPVMEPFCAASSTSVRVTCAMMEWSRHFAISLVSVLPTEMGRVCSASMVSFFGNKKSSEWLNSPSGSLPSMKAVNTSCSTGAAYLASTR